MTNLLLEQTKNGTLSHAYIIDNDNEELVKNILLSIKTEPSEQYFLEDSKVESIRKIKQVLSYRPLVGERKAIIIREAHNLSLPAQNSLLKVLEEPPAYAVILLFTAKDDLLLPTIKSRCQLIRLEKAVSAGNFEEVDWLVKSSVAERFKFVEKALAAEMDLDKLLDQWLSFFHNKLLKGEEVESILAKLKEGKYRINSNVNKRLLLENILLDF